MVRRTPKILAAALALSLGFVSQAQAFTIGTLGVDPNVGNPAIWDSVPTVGITSADLNQSFAMNWLLPATQGPTKDLKASGIFTVTLFSSSELRLEITLANETDTSYQAALMSLGLATTPDATGSFVSTGTVFDGVEDGNGAQQTFPGGFKGIDVCAFGGNGCAGSSINDGLQSGSSDTFVLSFAGSFGDLPAITLADFAVKFQTSSGSYELPGTSPEPEPGGSVPESGTLGLLGLALMGAAFAGRRRRH